MIYKIVLETRFTIQVKKYIFANVSWQENIINGTLAGRPVNNIVFEDAAWNTDGNVDSFYWLLKIYRSEFPCEFQVDVSKQNEEISLITSNDL